MLVADHRVESFQRFLHRRKARAFCLSVRGLTRLIIHQPFAFGALERASGALCVFDAKARAVAVAEIELGEITMQMRLANAVIDTRDPALENRIVVFDRVRVRPTAELGVFVRRMIDGVVAGEFRADCGIDRAFIGHERALFVRMLVEDFLDLLAGDVGDVERTGAAIAFNEGNDGFLGRGLVIGSVLRLAADVAFIGFNDLILSAERAFARLEATAHRFANAMRHEPRRAVRAEAKIAEKLMRAHALLAGAKQMRGEQPLVHGDMRALEDRSHSGRELLATLMATVKAMARGFGNNRVGGVHNSAMRANRTIRPADDFKVLPSGGFVVEDRVGKIDGHLRAPMLSRSCPGQACLSSA